MQEHTYAFIDNGKFLIGSIFEPLDEQEIFNEEPHHPEGHTSLRARIVERVKIWLGPSRSRDLESEEAPVEKERQLISFLPVDFDNTGQRERAIKHFINVVRRDESVQEVSYIALRQYMNEAKIRYYLEQELRKEGLDITGVIEAVGLEMCGEGVDTSSLVVLTISVHREER